MINTPTPTLFPSHSAIKFSQVTAQLSKTGVTVHRLPFTPKTPTVFDNLPDRPVMPLQQPKALQILYCVRLV